MAKRTNWKIEFRALLGSKRLVGRDRTFIESLHRHYSSGKAMTSGRKHHFFLVKERIAQLEAGGANGDQTIEDRCGRLLGRTPASSWDRGFVESLQGQNALGRALSPKQLQILEKIESRYTDEAVAAARGFSSNYDSGKRVTAIRMAKYYEKTTYFRDLVDRILSDDEFVPTKKQFDSITTNKYAAKVLQGYENPAMYVVGVTVKPRSGCHWQHAQQFRRGGIVLSVTEAIRSACKGNRMYKILPIGGVKPILVEERYLKVRR
jgi:hypothetical protein